MNAEIIMAQEDQAGCWIDGHVGHYGSATVIEIANKHGYEKDVSMAQEYLYGDCSSPMCEFIDEASDEAEVWMNEHIAPEGFSFGWFEGEFFLWDEASWQEV